MHLAVIKSTGCVKVKFLIRFMKNIVILTVFFVIQINFQFDFGWGNTNSSAIFEHTNY